MSALDRYYDCCVAHEYNVADVEEGLDAWDEILRAYEYERAEQLINSGGKNE